MELDPVRVRLLSLLKKTGSNMKTASLAIGKNPAYLHQFVYRNTPKAFPEDVREALAKHLGVENSLLRHLEVPPRKPPSESSPREDDEDAARPRRRRGLSEIHEIDVRASAGPGAMHDDLEGSKESWFFPETMVRHELRARPDDLRIITIDGDSMEPLLSSGDGSCSIPVSASPCHQGYS